MLESNYEKALILALEEAFSRLQQSNVKEIAFKSGASYEGEERLKLSYLHRTADVDAQEQQILISSSPAQTRTSILILHYLLRASGKPLTGRTIGFKEVPQGGLYFQPFRNRVILATLGMIEKDPAAFEAYAKKLGGERMQAGDLSYRFRVFPYVTVQFIWHRAEEGIPSDLNILFDASVPEYLSTEDIVVMCEEINKNLKLLQPRQSAHKIRGRDD